MVVRVDPVAQGYSQERTTLFFQQLEEHVWKLPGVRDASVVAPLPIDTLSSSREFTVPGTHRSIGADLHVVGPHYFATMGIPLIRGRDFREIGPSSPEVAVISRSMAEHLFPREDPVGRPLAWEFRDEKKIYEIIGVAGDAKSKTIGEAPRPCVYELAAQNKKDLASFSGFGGVSLVIKTVGEARALARAVQQEVERLEPGLPVYGVETMEEQIGKALVLARISAIFLAVFGLLALSLAGIGLYGMMSYSVAARTREIAIRMALGASPVKTLSMVARQGLTVVVGLLAGLAASLAVGRLVSSLLYGANSIDPLTFVTVPIVLVAVASLAILVPACRAARVDPMLALRYE